MFQKTLCTLFVFILTSFIAFSQDFRKQFKELAAQNDTLGKAAVLHAWEAASPRDPELFVAYFNFYLQKSSTEMISLDSRRKDDHSFELSDTGTGQPIAYLNSMVAYDSLNLQKAFEYIDKGIGLYPTRLDMRFGKIYLLGEAERYAEFTKAITEAIEYGHSVNHAWLWKEGKPQKDGEAFFLSSLQDYVLTLYNTEDDSLLPYIRQISETVLKYYPAHVESLSNTALTYVLVGDLDKALPYLLKAESAAPKDVVVLNNLAEIYKRKKDNDKARAYYQKVIRYGNKEEAQDAREKMQQL